MQKFMRVGLLLLIPFCLGFSESKKGHAQSREHSLAFQGQGDSTVNPKIRLKLNLEQKIQQSGFRANQDPFAERLRQIRIAHARELMGSYYRGSLIEKTESIADIKNLIHDWVRELLPNSYTRFSRIIAKGILQVSLRYRFDPLFVMSVIMTESSFRPKVRGTSGEWGLMQLMPQTGKWKAELLGVSWRGEKMLKHPLVNVHLGTAYLAYLRDRFNQHSQLYLAAYNMGQGNVNHALKRSIWPKDYPKKVMAHYLDFYERFVDELPENQLKTNRKLAAKGEGSRTYVIYEDTISARSSAQRPKRQKELSRLEKSNQKRKSRTSDSEPAAL
jgi:soluble lytic murein transglycosylase